MKKIMIAAAVVLVAVIGGVVFIYLTFPR